ncbi:MAG TPA: HepT-like ribonuclease domain-containing protein [Opitutaceae bacterium]|nr:HepT-like ribonuclease domain-containing protein [Opitutaceae bacterium]
MSDDLQQALLRDLLDSARAIRRYLFGHSKEAFLADMEKQDAVLRRFEIIGEVASRLAPETQALFPGIPFRAMRGMRNIIAHDYGEVDLDLVWRTANNDLEPLVEAVERHFAQREPHS